MKNDMLMYEKIYKILKNKIENGLFPDGSQLPSRANLCKEFNTSEKTVRRAMDLLAQDGLVKTSKRKRPMMKFSYVSGYPDTIMTLQRAIKCQQMIY